MRRNPTTLALVLALILTVAAGLAGCSSETDDAADAPSSTPAASDDTASGIDALTPHPSFAGVHPSPYSWATDGTLIAHGMGAIGEHRVTNTLEAFQENYEAGFRVFEVDLVFTSDGTLVARHDWEPYMYSFLGQNVADNEQVLSLDEFRALSIHGSYTPLTGADLMAILRAYPDVFIITDTKSGESADVTSAMEQLVEAMGEDLVLAERLIIQIYDEPMLETVRAVHPFENVIYTLYQLEGSETDAVAFARENGVQVITYSEERWTAEFAQEIVDAGLIGAVHTVNDETDATSYRESGVSMLYTDFLAPGE